MIVLTSNPNVQIPNSITQHSRSAFNTIVSAPPESRTRKISASSSTDTDDDPVEPISPVSVLNKPGPIEDQFLFPC